jgi:putative transposase
MRKSRFSEVQIVRILRQADAGERTVGQLYREHGISENTFYHWRRRYGGMGLPELRRQRQLEESARLKRLLAERDPEVDALRELLARRFMKLADRKDAVASLWLKGVSKWTEQVRATTRATGWSRRGDCLAKLVAPTIRHGQGGG